MSQIIMTKEDLLARLKAQYDSALVVDREALAKHRSAERDVLDNFKARVKEAASWNYQQLREHADRWDRWEIRIDLPPCPISKATQFETLIQQVTLSNQGSYTLSDSGVHGALFTAVTWDLEREARARIC